MDTLHIEATLTQDGKLILDHLPFRAGDVVEVIIQSHPTFTGDRKSHVLKGLPIQYDQPTEPVTDQDWEAAR